jgi:hypothetical protein
MKGRTINKKKPFSFMCHRSALKATSREGQQFQEKVVQTVHPFATHNASFDLLDALKKKSGKPKGVHAFSGSIQPSPATTSIRTAEKDSICNEGISSASATNLREKNDAHSALECFFFIINFNSASETSCKLSRRSCTCETVIWHFFPD